MNKVSGNFFNRVKKRDDQLFTDLMASCHNELYRLAWHYLKNEHDALDALQEVSCRVYKHFHKVENPKYVKTWMIRIMINYCLDELKRQKKAMSVDSVPDRFETPPDQAAKLDIEQLVHGLDEKYQLIILLKYYHQYTLSEIAENLDIPLGTVKTRLNHGLERLRKQLDREEEH
ncbi:RNA polymerase sigma factor [Sporolactobacillus laevolacticus]|uniref:RNA polymerase sigma factor n=1 Tax=Sporolactobacillus laevolacticus TaxID=33018 RepID=UPI0025B47E04|nr:sigma-70 family RNA polymerase sigma factor [Sporolactobacillus laevolacticus]MDN3954526.1 sigma-70 family RNA polymerase sigma factor [Sporolactobacillus laevolacticus]